MFRECLFQELAKDGALIQGFVLILQSWNEAARVEVQ